MASHNVSHLLGTLQEDPENDEVLQDLAGLVENGASPLDEEEIRLIDTARRGHDSRAEYRAVAQLLEVEARLAEGSDPDKAATLLKELGYIQREELLDDKSARGAYERALALRPGDEDIQDALEQLEQTASKWNDIAKRFVEEAENASDPTLKSSLLVSAASLIWKYKKKGRDKQVDQLFKRALNAAAGDARAARLYEQVLRRREKWSELAGILLETADAARENDEKIRFLVRAGRLLHRRVGDGRRAAACFERVMDYQPEHKEALTFLAAHFMESEDWDHLVALYEDALRSRTRLEDEAGVLLQLGMVHWRFRDAPDAAEPYFARLRKSDPANPGMLDFYREHLKDDEQRWVTILTDAQRVATSEEQRLNLAIELARAAQDSSGGTERAIDAWKAVLRLDPTHPEAPEALKALYEKTEKWNALVELLKTEADAIGDEHPERRVALLRHLIPIYRDKLGLDVMVINTYNAVLQLDPTDQEALDALAETYESTGRWNDLIQVLGKQAESSPDTERKVALHMRVAGLWIDRFANYNQATAPLETVIEIEPDNRAALSQLKEIYQKKRAWKHLYEVLVKEAGLASDPDARLAYKLELAELAGKRLHRHADAIALWKEILEQDPERAEAVDNLEKLAEREKDWGTLADVLERRVLEAPQDRDKIKVLQKLGVIYGEHLNEGVRAASAWKRILDVDPKNGRALRTLRETFLDSHDWEGLEALYAEASDWEGLVDVLGNAAEKSKDDALKVELSFRAADIYESRLEQPHRAFRSYERVLSADPANEQAARALIPLYERGDKWNRLPALYEVLLGHASDDEGRLEILRTLQALSVERLSDDAAAYGYASRAFQIAPTDEAVRASLSAATVTAAKFAETVDLYLARLEAIADDGDADDERAFLRRRVATLASERLDRTPLAIEQLRALLAAVPDDAEAADSLSQIYRASGQHPELQDLLLHRVGYAADAAEKIDYLGQLAVLEEEVLEDADAAAGRFRQMLEIDGTDRRALTSLDRLCVAAARWEEVAALIGTRRELAASDDERLDLTLRLGEVLSTALEDNEGALAAFGEVVDGRPHDGRAIAGLELVAELAPELRLDVGRTLERAYEATGAWEKLAGVLKHRLDQTKDREEKRRLRLRYAELASAKTGDALAAYRALEAAFLAEPTDSELSDRLVDAAEAASQHEALAAAFSSAMSGDRLSPDETAELAAKVADIYDAVLGRTEEAEPFHKRVLEHDPLDERSFLALKELYTNGEEWEGLQHLYRRRIEETVDPDAKLDLVMQVCFLFEELIDDPEQAINAYRDVLELDPEHAASRRALERLYERTERWEGLVELLRHELDRANPDEQLGLTQRLGMLHEKKLARPDLAVDSYERVLMTEPNHRHAREALERLLNNEGQRQRCARILEPIYEERADWQELVEVLQVQLEDVGDSGSRVAIWSRIAQLQEDRLHDPSEAFGSMANALEADPGDVHVREELARLSMMRDAEQERARVLERALEATTDQPGLQSELLLELALLWDERVGDVDQAEEAYRRLIDVDRDNPDVVLRASRALERIHLGKGDHPALAEDLRRQVQLEHDVETQRSLLVRLADLLEEVLGDVEGAIATHRRRLDLEPGDIDALRSLERLYEAQEQWPLLIEMMRARDGVVADEEEQREIAYGIGVIFEEQLGDDENAIIAYNDVLSRFGRDADTLGALSRLYERAERWDDLLDVAEMVHEMAEQAPTRAAVRFQMGEILRICTDDVERAVEMYSEVLDLLPDHEGALASLAFVMHADGTKRPAVDVPVEAGDGETAAGEDDEAGDGEAETAQSSSEEASSEEASSEEASSEGAPPPVEYDLDVRIHAARVLAPRYESTADFVSLLEALSVLAETDDPLERFRVLRRAAEVADLGLEDSARSFELLGRAIKAGLAEDDLAAMLQDFARHAESSERWGEYADLLQASAPDILDMELAVHALKQVAETARDRLADPTRARALYDRVLEIRPDDAEALDALEEITAEGQDYASLLEVLRRKTELAQSSDERVALLLLRAELNEREVKDLESAIDCYEQALGDAQPAESYAGLERLYKKAERWPELAAHYERMLEDGVGEAVDIRHRLGVVQLERLEDAWAATDQFREALNLDVGHPPTIAALESLMETPEHRSTAAEILEPVFLQQMAWPKVTECLEARIAEEEDVEERKAHLTRLGQIHEDYLEDLDGALESYARLFREDPRDTGSWETLSRLARVLERYDRLAEIYQAALDDISVDDDETAKLAFTAGQIHDQRTGDLAAAGRLYARALRFDPTDHEVFIALESVHKRREAWDDLLALYRGQAQTAEQDEDRVALIRKSAALLETQLESSDRAIEAYRDILMVSPQDPNAIAALDELLVQQEKWADLADHYRHQIGLVDDEAEANDLKLKLGATLQHQLDDKPAAIDVYEEITESDPHHTDTVGALEQLVQDGEHQLRIIRILEPIYLATDQWRKRIAIYEAQVELGLDPYEKVRFLTQIAQLHEERSGDLQLAFHAWARAMAFEPDNDEIRGEVDRIASQLGTWDAHVAAYEEALSKTEDMTVQASLLGTMARVHDEKRGDPRAAIETYERLLEADPGEASPLDSLEALHTMVGDWRGMVDVLKRKVERSYDAAERGELLRRAGSVLEELLGDPKGAIEVYKSALVEDEVDVIALESLDRLYTGQGSYESLADVLRRRVELEEEPEYRIDAGMRLGQVSEEQLRRPEDAIEAYRRVVDEDPDQVDAIRALARLYERQALWPDLLENLRQQAGMEADADRRVQLLFRAGEVLEREIDDVLAALPTYEEVLQLDSRFEPAIQALLRIGKLEDYRVQASEIVEPLLRTQERWDELAALLQGKAAASYDPEDKRVELRRLAEVHELGRNDNVAAFEAYKAALAEDARDEQTANDIERLASELGAWDKAADAFAVRASSVLEPDVARSLYGRLARIAEEHLGDDTRAVEAYTRAIEQAGDDPSALAALDRLYTKITAWPELGEILERRIQSTMDPDERAELLVRLGALKHERFTDLRGAFRAFSEVLDSNPQEPRAVTAMEALLEDDELAPDVVEVLDAVYRSIGATEKVAALFDVRIHLADTEGERVRFLQDQAAVYEQELGDSVRAIQALKKAFALDPRDVTLADDLERLAPMADGGWESLNGIVEAVLEEKKDDLDRMIVRDLNMRAARWYRDQLGNAAGAEARYRAAVQADPDTPEAHASLVALLRVGGREVDLVAALRHWAEIDYDEDAKKVRLTEAASLAEQALGDATIAISCHEAILEVDGAAAESLDELIRLHRAADHHDKVAQLLGRRIEVEMDPDVRLRLRKQLAGALASLGRTEDAIDAWRGALDEEPTDLECIGALESLYEGQGRWPDLEDLIQRRLDVAETSADRIAARVRLARLAENAFGRREEAITQLGEILEEDPGNPEALDELERLYAAGEQWPELVTLLERRAEDAASAGDLERELAVLVRLGEVHVEQLSDAEKAIGIYERVLERQARHPGALAALVGLHRERQDFAAAVATLEQLGEVQTGADAIASALLVAELADEKLEDASRAEHSLVRVYELDGGTLESRERLKAHYEKHGEAEKLATMLAIDEEEAEDPKVKVALLKRIADLYSQQLGDPGSAAQFLEKAAAIDSEDRDVLLPLCDLYIAAGRQNDAIPVLEQIIASYGTRRNKEVAVYHHRLGRAKQSKGDLDGAMESFDAAFKVDLTNVVVLTDLGRLCMDRGDLDRAQKTFRALLLQKLAPEDGIQKSDVYFYLGQISSKQGDERKAISMLERALAENSSHEEATALLSQLKS